MGKTGRRPRERETTVKDGNAHRRSHVLRSRSGGPGRGTLLYRRTAPEPAAAPAKGWLGSQAGGPELDAYKAWYDHWRKTQFVRQWHECPPRPGGCLISLPPPDVSVPPTRLHRPVDGRESVTIPEPWVFSVLVLPAALLIGASLPRPAESERSTQA